MTLSCRLLRFLVLMVGAVLTLPLSAQAQSVAGSVNLRAVGGTSISGADVIDPPTSAIRVVISPLIGAPQGSPAPLARAWPMLLTDGIVGPVAVTPPFVSPSASARALVVTMSPNSPALGTSAVGSPVPSAASYIAGQGTALRAVTVCDNWTVINITTDTRMISGSPGKQTYICSINVVVSAADNVALVEGTGSVCATGIAGMAGGTTAAAGWNFVANGGLVQGTGVGAIARTATSGDDVCLLRSSAAQISGVLGFTQY